MTRIRTGCGLWSQLVDRAGLDLRRYDVAVASELRSALSLPLTGRLTDRIREHKVGTEALLAGFLTALQPFTQMYSDILNLIEAIGLAEGKENLLVEFDFETAARNFKLDLENFRKQVARWQNSVRPMSFDRWNTDRLWRLVNALGDFDRDYRNDPRIRDWVARYEAGYWPENELKAPTTGEDELGELLRRVWAVRNALIEGARLAGPRRADLNKYHFGATTELIISDEGVQSSDEAFDILRVVHSDLWAEAVTLAAYARADEARADASTKYKLIERLRKVLDNPPAERRDVESTIREIEDLLSLPIWKQRYELYSIWVLTRIVDALGGAAKFRFTLDGDVFHVPFAPRRLAVLEDTEPSVSVWGEVRYPLANPRGKGRKSGMQPDFTLTADVNDPPREAFALIECKQYLKAKQRTFGDVLTDYATGQPKAQVVLVNYGPAKQSIGNYVPITLRPQTKIIGDMRPLQDASVEDFRSYLQGLLLRYGSLKVGSQTSQAKPSFTANSNGRHSQNIGTVELRWQEVPADLDLYAFLPKDGVDLPISFSQLGTLDAHPWAQLDQDVRHGFGPEIITLRRAIPGIYRFAVKAHSDDAPLADCGAVVTLDIGSGPSRVFACPPNGEGRWWHVFDYDSTGDRIVEVNVIQDAPPRVS